jgi:hypothetical protein
VRTYAILIPDRKITDWVGKVDELYPTASHGAVLKIRMSYELRVVVSVKHTDPVSPHRHLLLNVADHRTHRGPLS